MLGGYIHVRNFDLTCYRGPRENPAICGFLNWFWSWFFFINLFFCCCCCCLLVCFFLGDLGIGWDRALFDFIYILHNTEYMKLSCSSRCHLSENLIKSYLNNTKQNLALSLMVKLNCLYIIFFFKEALF